MDTKTVIGLALLVLALLLGGKDYLAGVNGVLGGAVNVSNTCSGADAHWKSAESIGTIDAFEDHLSRFGSCAFANFAIKRINSMRDGTRAGTSIPVIGSHGNDSEPCGEIFKGKNSDGVPEYTLNFDCKRGGERQPDEIGKGWNKSGYVTSGANDARNPKQSSHVWDCPGGGWRTDTGGCP